MIVTGYGFEVIKIVVFFFFVVIVVDYGGITLRTLKIPSNSFEDLEPGTVSTSCPIDIRVWCTAKGKRQTSPVSAWRGRMIIDEDDRGRSVEIWYLINIVLSATTVADGMNRGQENLGLLALETRNGPSAFDEEGPCSSYKENN